MEKLTKLSKVMLKLSLDSIESLHSYFLYILSSQNIIRKEYTTKIISFEEQLDTYSPLTLILFGIFLIFFYYFIKFIYSFFIKFINFFLNIKENLIILYCKLPAQRKFLEKTKEDINNEFRKMFKKKFKKIEFYDNKQDYTKILSKMEENLKGDKVKIENGKLTGSVYCLNDQIKYIAGEAAKMFLYSNLLHPDIYTYNRYLESELIKLGVQLFNGKEDACGVTTWCNHFRRYYVNNKCYICLC